MTVCLSAGSARGARTHCLTDTSPILIDLLKLTCERLPAVLSVGPPQACWAALFRLMSALPRHCYARHTCSGTWIEMRASMWPCVSLVCQVRLPLILIATADVSVVVSAETRKPIYRIDQYCNAASIHSPISDISLTLCINDFTSKERYPTSFSFWESLFATSHHMQTNLAKRQICRVCWTL